jgi:hypothetical protein
MPIPVWLRIGLTHLLRPRRNRHLDRAFVPAVGFRAGHMARKLLAGHFGQLLGLENDLVGGRAVGRNDAAQRPDVANVAHQRACIDVPNDGDLVAVQVKLRAFRRPPIRRDLGEFPDNQRFDVRARGLFVFGIRANIANVRVSEADNLPRVTWVGENFLVTGEARIENYFTAAARNGARGTAVKEAPVFQREGRGSVLDFCQWSLLAFSCTSTFICCSLRCSRASRNDPQASTQKRRGHK